VSIRPPNASFKNFLRICGILAICLLAVAARPAPKQSGQIPRERYLSPIEMAVSADGRFLYVVCQDSDEVRVVDAASGTVTTVIKVHGTMSARAASESGTPVLRVRFDYLFVFAVEPPGDPAGWMRIVQQQYGSVDFASWDEPGGPLEPWVYDTGVGTAGVQCSVRDGYIHPDYPRDRSSGLPASGAPQDPYSTATPSAGPAESCQTITGT